MSEQKIRNMEEFAAAIGVSRPTVSKFFNDPASVRPKTREKIEEALERHDYRPNVFAINQNRRSTKNIGVVVPNLADPFFLELARRVELACIDAGYTPIVRSSHGVPELESANLETLRDLKPAGVLLAPFGRESDIRSIKKFDHDFPLVLFDADLSGVGQAFCGTDNFQSINLMVEYLCRSGEPPCFFEMKTPANPNADTRRQAYIESMERHNERPRVHQAMGQGWDFEAIGLAEGGRLLSAGAFETQTILCSNDRLAIGLLAAAYGLGRRVGHGADCNLRVAGHDDHPFSRFTCPALTTISQDYDGIVSRAVTSLLQAIERDRSRSERIDTTFEGRLIMRDSA
ncbi:LacI family DNA-binding transcriptional regulator [Palleronia caenipelagi]|uniref:LacI family transcriptional regulator n=1 Tax=Palleronia caenipelagi TaxID=2489174 RepID=A0A547PUR9_9RHOB|nr:LacI family DNA-binding transcriptional regulator [Palleronia caenipelagi]TRD17868.1 LacI family transcriptional regulator [Palleronia caenipelagi]